MKTENESKKLWFLQKLSILFKFYLNKFYRLKRCLEWLLLSWINTFAIFVVFLPKRSFSFQNDRLHFKTIVFPFLKTIVLKTIIFRKDRLENDRSVFLLKAIITKLHPFQKRVFKNDCFQKRGFRFQYFYIVNETNRTFFKKSQNFGRQFSVT